MTPADRAALEIGQMFLRAHSAEQQAALLAERLAEVEADLSALRAEHENDPRLDPSAPQAV